MLNIFYIFAAFFLGSFLVWYLLVLKLRDRCNVLFYQLEEYKTQKNTCDKKIDSYLEENTLLVKKNAHLEADIKHKNQHIDELLTSGNNNKEVLTMQFKLLAESLLEEKSKKFTNQNKINIESLLKPLGEKIEKFEKTIVDTNKDHIERTASLKTEVRKLSEISARANEESANLSKAIKGDTKFQGSWGEFILENVLEKSGLKKNREYVVQPSYKNENDRQSRPDIVINLPDNKHLVIDAKFSLINYERFFNASTPDTKQEELKKHIESIRRHIKDLSQREYQQLYQLNSLDFVLMFIPIEPAFGLAIQEDSDIFNFAYEKNIIIVSPSTLLATLRTIANIWQNEYRNLYAYEIARQGGEMYNKFVNFLEDLQKIGVKLSQAQEVHQNAMKKLNSGHGNLIKRAERIKLLGAKASKHIPQDSILEGHIE